MRHLRSTLTKGKEVVTQWSFYETRNWNIFENKTNKMRIFLLLLTLTLIFGCATRNIKYDRNKILKKYSSEYKMFVDNQKMDLETVFLNKDNIENIRIDKRAKELNITQLKPAEFYEMRKLKLDSVISENKNWKEQSIEMVIIDGIPIVDTLLQKTKIDPNAIRTFTILTQDKMNEIGFCRGYSGKVILITTE